MICNINLWIVVYFIVSKHAHIHFIRLISLTLNPLKCNVFSKENDMTMVGGGWWYLLVDVLQHIHILVIATTFFIVMNWMLMSFGLSEMGRR